MADIKRGSNILGDVLGFVRQYESIKTNVVSLTGVPYTQTTGLLQRRLCHVYCDTYEKHDALDDANNDGALLVIDWDGRTFKGYIEDKRITWKEKRDGSGVGKFTFMVKEVVS